MALLAYSCKQFSATEKIKIKTLRNHLTEIIISGALTGFHFLDITSMNLPLIETENAVTDFLQLDKLVSDNFSISLSTFEAKSITQLSKLYYFHSCCKYNSIALISPPSSLYNLMKKECRFGY